MSMSQQESFIKAENLLHKVLGLDGEQLALPWLWKDRRVLVVFLRHLGCRFCWQQAAAFNAHYDELEKAGVPLVAISMGTVEAGKEFVQRVGFKGDLYLDIPSQPNSYGAYKQMKLVGGNKDIFNEDSKRAAITAEKDGFTDKPFFSSSEEEWTGDIFQLGGVFVLGPGNTCDYSFRSKWAGDNPPIRDVIRAAVTDIICNNTNSNDDDDDNDVFEYRADPTQEYVYPHTTWWSEKLSITSLSKPTGPEVPPLLLVGLIVFVWMSALLVTYVMYTRGKMWSFEHWISLVVTLGLPISLYSPLASCLSSNGAAASSSGADISSNEAVTSSSGAATSSNGAPTLQLYTPSEIDDIILSKGLVQCDCSPIVSSIPFESKTDISKPSEANPCEFVKHINDKEAQAMQTTLCYLREFLAKHHPAVGRSGPVCPFVPRALKLDSLHIGVIRTNTTISAEFMKNVVTQGFDMFDSLQPTAGRRAIFKAIIIVFPDMLQQHAPKYIDDVQAALKPLFVKKGMMIGEFHMHNNTAGLRNPNFFPLRTPVPTIAMRHMVPSDIVFLTPDKYSPQQRRDFLASYIEKFDEKSGSVDIEQAKQKLAIIDDEMKP